MSVGEQQIPPWLQEQVGRMQQLQQNLQSIMMQKQHLESEHLETERALEVLQKTTDDDIVYKTAGSILVKSTKAVLLSELEEKKELANTRLTVLSKQESRIKENLKEAETKIREMLRGPTTPPGPQKTDVPK
ncbi:MAG: prefoldin subunit beta [Thaumarchaeota archaeon]|nr:prefoldin subunit beta [Nitrososphaerota archaeon]MDE1831266.1 prefoldin subunit beta [Nitrososphaerota archaeon]MDE1841822.1 prefoldin subunit beta [Nitrososphaerota archaeon]MDE1877342.1 prefoldin subunit beta [Nitrososphaerota archaeon]